MSFVTTTTSLQLPHSANLPYTLTDGKEIIVRGTIEPYCERFSVNLCNGPTQDSDVALTFNPRFDQNEVVRTHKTGDWGTEEKHGGFPFYKGQAYEIRITVRQNLFQIFVNNTHFCDFHHRVAKEMVHFVYVEGGTQLHAVEFRDTNGASFQNPPVPFTTPIQGGAQPGRTLYIDGIPWSGASRFNVNLMCGPNFEYDDVCLHFDVRFNYGDNHNVVVRTHKAGGGWGAEERHQHTGFPFYPNTPFSMMILVEHSSIKIAVNGQHFCEFNHRVHPVHRMNHLNIQGDVNLTSVRL